MSGRLKRSLLRFLRVPERPASPPGSEETLVAFRSSQRFFWLMVLRWFVRQTSAFAGLVFSVMFLRGNIGFAGLSQFYEAIKRVDTIRWGPLSIEASLIDLFTLLELFAIGGYLVQFVVSGLLVRLQWEMRWYLVSDESLRLREGLWSLHEQTMTIANIQNLAVRRGPLQRLLGIGDLEVHTAGGGSGGQAESLKSAALHIGRFRDIDNPEALRDRIRRVLARHRDAGLGDPDDVHHGDEGPHVAVATAVAAGGPAKVGAGVGAEGIAQALGGLLAEARALRRAAEAAYG